MSRAAEPIDELVEAVVVERLSRPDAADLLTTRAAPDVSAYRSQAKAIRERLDDLATGLADGLLTLKAVRSASERLQRELAEVEAKIAATVEVDALAPLIGAADVEEVWQRLDLEQKRGAIDALMVVTLLSPLRGRQAFDPDTVRIEWR